MWRAVTALWLALAQAPNDPASGVKALEEGRYAEAAAIFQKLVDADASDYAALFHLALANSLLGKDAEAIAGYQKVLELKPGLYEAQVNLGMVLLRVGRAKEALAPLEEAVEQKPKEARPNFYLAEALLALAETSKAEPYYRTAAALDPSLRDGLLKLAAAYEAKGEAAKATELYGLFPENPGARERMGVLLLEAGKPSEAIPHLEWVVAKSPTSANRAALAAAYKQLNQLDKAESVLQQAVAAAPEDMDLRMRYGRVLRDQKKYQAAAAEFYRVAMAAPTSVEVWNELAGMLILLENYPQALAALDRIRQMGGETPSHLYLRAIMLDRMGQPKPALESYQKFLELSNGKFPDEEFKARQRVRILQKESGRR